MSRKYTRKSKYKVSDLVSDGTMTGRVQTWYIKDNGILYKVYFYDIDKIEDRFENQLKKVKRGFSP
jgi:hypothetical protein